MLSQQLTFDQAFLLVKEVLPVRQDNFLVINFDCNPLELGFCDWLTVWELLGGLFLDE